MRDVNSTKTMADLIAAMLESTVVAANSNYEVPVSIEPYNTGSSEALSVRFEGGQKFNIVVTKARR